ncbi:MAG: hypothetical protein MJ240_01455 [Kiritimatiellae bacterium]|nr:hypothetical protein [Kiritimatiellia bacterium]
MDKKYFILAVISTLLTVAYYAWMIPAWVHLDDPPRARSSKSISSQKTKNVSASYYSNRDYDDRPRRRGETPPDYAYYIQRPRYRCNSVLKINTSHDASYVIKVVDPYDGEIMMMCYLPSGTSQEIDMPSGKFEIRYTCGTEWFGDGEMFGDTASYAKAQGLFDFSEGSGYELTLYRVRNGNLRTSKMRKEDF